MICLCTGDGDEQKSLANKRCVYQCALSVGPIPNNLTMTLYLCTNQSLLDENSGAKTKNEVLPC